MAGAIGEYFMCEMCKHHIDDEHHPLLQRMDALIGVTQRLLDVINQTFGMPRSPLSSFVVAAPVQNTIYPAPPSNVQGVLRYAVINGNGNVSLYIQDLHVQGGQQLIFRGTINGQPIPLPLIRVAMAPGSTLAIATDSASPTLLSLSYHIEPIDPTEDQLFYLRKSR
jgi:hypothetical protein